MSVTISAQVSGMRSHMLFSEWELGPNTPLFGCLDPLGR